ncbi:hypothetical protein ACFWG6_00205 [Streptomyces erythrochromogenes]|uniref:hypothetical protein n=1 Tax=Streptomyces erythrochromogenes TaxID=285574 RepID=UPI003624C75F
MGTVNGIAREIFRYLTTPVTVPDVSDLRPPRRAKNITRPPSPSTSASGPP